MAASAAIACAAGQKPENVPCLLPPSFFLSSFIARLPSSETQKRRLPEFMAPPAEISSRLLAQANSGDPDALWQLHLDCKPGDCTITIVKVALKYLKSEFIPTIGRWHLQDPHRTYFDRALPSLRLLSAIGQSFQSKPKLKELAIPLILGQVDDICSWILYSYHFIDSPVYHFGTPADLKDYGSAYSAMAEVISDLLQADSRLVDAFAVNPVFIELAIHGWMAERSQELVVLYERDICCPIIFVMQRTVAHEVGREALVQSLFSSGGRFQESFVQAVTRRARQVVQKKTIHWKAIRHIQGLIRLTQDLVSHQVQVIDFRRFFIQTKYLSEFASALDYVSLAAMRARVTEPMILQSIVHTTFNLFKILSYTTSRAVSNCRDLVRGGAFGHLVRVVSIIPPGDRAAAQEIKTCLETFGIYVAYPSILKLLIAGPIPDDIRLRAASNPIVGSTWMEYHRSLTDFTVAYKAATHRGFNFCDNPSCNHLKTSHASHECSGCSSVIYCSRECQRTDWEARHSEECRYERSEGSRRRASDTYYTHRSRSFHAQLIAHVYTNDPQRKALENDPDLTINHVIPVYSCTSRGSVLASMRLLTDQLSSMLGQGAAHDAWWKAPSGRKFPQTWLRPRTSQLVEGYRDDAFSRDVRVAEGMFQLGHLQCFVHVTVKLERSSSGKYEAVYCTSRYSDRVSA